MILPTVPERVVLGRSGIRAVSSFSSAIFADLAMRGCAISFLTLASDAFSNLFLLFLSNMHPSCHRDGSRAVPFRTIATLVTDSLWHHPPRAPHSDRKCP